MSIRRIVASRGEIYSQTLQKFWTRKSRLNLIPSMVWDRRIVHNENLLERFESIPNMDKVYVIRPQDWICHALAFQLEDMQQFDVFLRLEHWVYDFITFQQVLYWESTVFQVQVTPDHIYSGLVKCGEYEESPRMSRSGLFLTNNKEMCRSERRIMSKNSDIRERRKALDE